LPGISSPPGALSAIGNADATFHINRASMVSPAKQKKVLEKARGELRAAFGRWQATGERESSIFPNITRLELQSRTIHIGVVASVGHGVSTSERR
jgi:hypothetical protein